MSSQETAVLFVVAGAATYVAWRAYQALRGENSRCGSGCGACPSSRENGKQGVLLTIEPPARR